MSFESINSVIKDRISDPLLGSFFVSLSATNWEVLVFLFGTGDSKFKIAAIETYFSNVDWWINLGRIAFPVVLALFYTFVWPKMRNKYLTYLDKDQAKRNQDVADLDKTLWIEKRKYYDDLSEAQDLLRATQDKFQDAIHLQYVMAKTLGQINTQFDSLQTELSNLERPGRAEVQVLTQLQSIKNGTLKAISNNLKRLKELNADRA